MRDKLHPFPSHAEQTALPCSVSSCKVVRSLRGRFVGCSALTTICAYLVSATYQPCAELTYNKQNSGRNVYGQIVEIVAPLTSGKGAVAVLDLFGLKASRHPIFGMPVLSRSLDCNSYLIVNVEVSQTRAPIGLICNRPTGCRIPVQHSTRLCYSQMHRQQTRSTTAGKG